MPRIIVPPFQHKSGSTELEHALDARKLDEAFSELSGVLNGGIDESNLNSTVKFSTVTPGGVSVGTAIYPKYSIVTLTGRYLKDRNTNGIVLGYTAGGSNWLFIGGTIRGLDTGLAYLKNDVLAAGGTLWGGAGSTTLASLTNRQANTDLTYSFDLTPVSPVSVASGTIIWCAPTLNEAVWIEVEATFKVPVL